MMSVIRSDRRSVLGRMMTIRLTKARKRATRGYVDYSKVLFSTL
jgi:hypothetical protein